MIQIIDGKRYNTETAEKVGEYWNGLSSSDFHNMSEDLYRTRNGSWFLYYKGGALSSYARSCGNRSYCGDSGLKAMTEDEAYAWLELHFQVEAIEKYFAERVQDA
jgi:hypothetical protein